MKCVIVTNIPAPYRNPIWERLPRGDYALAFCARTEGNRQWQLPPLNCDHFFLKERVSKLEDGFNFVHNNPDIWSTLNRLKPSVVVTTGINPTHLYAFGWARMHRARHIYMTDGTEYSEADLGWKHRLVRRMIIKGSASGVAASESGRRLLQSYGMAADRVHLSRLCADNQLFGSNALTDRPYDVMFCGQLHERKLPYLFAAVCKEIKNLRGSCRTLIVGDGPERDKVLSELHAADVDMTYVGFVQPAELASWYPQARLLLFTTRLDPWGVVANEAMASGTPVITTPQAGAAGDLVIDRVNGRVLPAYPLLWALACTELLDDPALWHQFSNRALEHVQSFNYDSAAAGLQAACDQALRKSLVR